MKIRRLWPACVAVLIVVALISVIAISSQNPGVAIDLSSRYNAVSSEAAAFKVLGSVNVRSEPIVLEEKADGTSNSFGRTSNENFTIEISKVFRTDKELDVNGEFYGFMVDEIMNTPEGIEWFPKGIVADPDGIVWINYKYVTIIYPVASR